MNVLFITSTRIGDAVLSCGLLDHILKTYPGARLTVACGPAAAPLFAQVPGLVRLIVLKKRRFNLHWLDFWGQVAPHLWSLVVDLRASTIAWLLLTARRRVFRANRDEPVHRVQQLAALFGLKDAPPAPRLWTSERQDAEAADLIPAGPVLAIGPTANWRGKTWRAERFAEVVARLTAPDGLLPGAPVAVFGAPGERAAAQPVLDSIPEARRIDLVGNLDLLTAYACLKRCALYIGNDSGLMHIAAAAKIPTLGLFGPSHPENYAPWGERAAFVSTAVPYDKLFPPGYNHRTTETLMDSLTVDAVMTAAENLWRQTGAKRS